MSSVSTSAPGILVDRELALLLGTALRRTSGAPAFTDDQLQPASVDLRLGPVAHRVRAGFLPELVPVEDRLAELSTGTVSLEGAGGVLERGSIHVVPLEEELALPADVGARFNPRSTTGRTDVFTRVLVPGFPRFDEAPPGFHGRLWLEVAPLSFPVHVRRGDRLCQVRLARGAAALSSAELVARARADTLCFDGARPLGADELRFDEDGGILLRLGLEGRDPCGWRATPARGTVELGRVGAHAGEEFFEPVHARDGHCLLEPGQFTLFASRERLRVPPDLAAEMLPVDVGIGELRNNYAGFFDPGFGWDERARPGAARGTPAVLEVRAHDLAFIVEEGQAFFRLKFFRTAGRPERLYGEIPGRLSYSAQDLTLARVFRPPR